MRFQTILLFILINTLLSQKKRIFCCCLLMIQELIDHDVSFQNTDLEVH